MRDADIIRQVNNTAISAVQLRDYIEACQVNRRPHDDEYNAMMQMMTAGDMSEQNPIRALALYYRARAMAVLVTKNEGAPGWVIQGPEQSVFVNESVFGAAAVEDVTTAADGEVVFDRANFLRRVLELCEPEIGRQ